MKCAPKVLANSKSGTEHGGVEQRLITSLGYCLPALLLEAMISGEFHDLSKTLHVKATTGHNPLASILRNLGFDSTLPKVTKINRDEVAVKIVIHMAMGQY